MTLGAHIMMSWLTANTVKWSRRERLIVGWAGLSPDLDGLFILYDFYQKFLGYHTNLYVKYHHTFGHNIFYAIVISVIAAFLAKQKRLLCGVLTFIALHLHYITDLLGSAGPYNSLWPIYYFYPVSDTKSILLWQWELVSWQNTVIFWILIFMCFWVSRKNGYSPFELLSKWFDEQVFSIARKYLVKTR